jgi:predicted dehydrogenase
VHAQGLAAALATLARGRFTGINDDDLARASTVAAPWAAARPGVARVFAAGVHVLCEKPLATSLADADAMIEACRAAGVQLGTLFPVRASPAVAAVRDAIGSGALGRVRAVRATNPGQYPGLWFGDPKQAGGGAVMDHTVHAADAIRWLLGQEYTRVHAELGSFIHRLAVEDCGLITCDLEPETFASIDCSWSRPSTFPTWGGVTLHVVGERATIDVDVFRQALTHYDDAAGRTRLIGWGDDLTSRTVGAFVDAVLDGRPVPIDGSDGLRALEVAVAAYRSSDAGAPIAIADLRR